MKRSVDIAGRFTIADQTAEYLAVGFIGSAWADSLTPAQLDHVCGFYGMTGKPAGTNTGTTGRSERPGKHLSNTGKRPGR